MHKSGGGCLCLPMLAPVVRNQWSLCIQTGRPSPVHSYLRTRLLLGATWGTRVVQNMPGSDTWWVKISRVSSVHAALALGTEHNNANTR